MEVWIGTVPHTSEEQYREMPQVFVCNEKNLNVEIERRCVTEAIKRVTSESSVA